MVSAEQSGALWETPRAQRWRRDATGEATKDEIQQEEGISWPGDDEEEQEEEGGRHESSALWETVRRHSVALNVLGF